MISVYMFKLPGFTTLTRKHVLDQKRISANPNPNPNFNLTLTLKHNNISGWRNDVIFRESVRIPNYVRVGCMY